MRTYLIKYKKFLKEYMLKREETFIYHIEIKAKDKKEAIKKISKKVGINNLIDIYLKLN